jgi:hypothetical protein
MSLGFYPVGEVIVQVATSRLESMADISGVIRENRKPETWTPQDRQIVITTTGPERLPEIDCPGNPPALGYSLQLNIRCHVVQSEDDTNPTDLLLSNFAADATKAIANDSGWYRFDGAALNATFGTIEKSVFDGGFDSINVPVLVQYRVSETDPYQVR